MGIRLQLLALRKATVSVMYPVSYGLCCICVIAHMHGFFMNLHMLISGVYFLSVDYAPTV